MPDEAILGGLLRSLISLVANLFAVLLEYVVERFGRVVIYVLTFGKVDTDQSAQEGVNWLAACAGFLAIAGICQIGWRVLSR